MSQTATGSEPTTGSPVGTWQEELFLERGTYASTLRFAPNGRALLLRGPRPGCVGAGSWTATGENRFSFRIAELVFEEDGRYTGWVDIEQHVVQDGDTFTSTGSSHVYDAEDHLLDQAEVRARGTRR
ncbi:hypothetical protein [Streptomyces sp. NPDC020362]|uniref:hypothetical protein n=1 Tax=unclassified Streptomyces TaxID=2593676 RepID=UPI000B1362E3